MTLTISGLRADPPQLEGTIDIVANLEADIRLDVGGHAVYEEVSFSVAELAIALARWSKVPPDDRPDFEFDSMSAEELAKLGLIWIRRVDDGWSVGSIHQERPGFRVVTATEIEALVGDYVAQLSDRVQTTFGSRASTYLVQVLRAAP